MTDAAPTRDRILVEMTIAAPPDEVWDALKDPAKIYNWHGWDDPSLKEEVEFIYVNYGNYDDAAKVLSFGEYEGVAYRFEVEPRGHGSNLRVIAAASADMDWDNIYKDVIEGWISFAQQLRFGLERHDIGPRRTLYLSGSAKPGGVPPIAALGLAGVRGRGDGEAVDIDLPTGERAAELWHQNKWQVGVTVPEWGDGLLIATDKSVTDESPDGRGALILTTYGFDDAAFAELESRWRGWWDAHYDKPGEAACS
jgi:uncharacterized protein YndB with AHSA1/START domain